VVNDTFLNVRMPSDLKELVRRVAKEQDRTMGRMVVHILKEWLMTHGHVRMRRAARRRGAHK